MNKSLNTLLLILIAILAMAAGLWLAKTIPDKTIEVPHIQGAIYSEAKLIQPFSLQTHQHTPFNQDSLKNKWSLFFIGYTHCPDICPTTLGLLNEVNKIYKDQNLSPVTIYFLSIDPDRDTVEVMQKYINYFNKDFVGLTGDKAEVDKLSRNLNAVYRKAPGLGGAITDDDYLMDHSSALMLINPDGKLQSILSAPHTKNSIVTSIIASQEYYKSL